MSDEFSVAQIARLHEIQAARKKAGLGGIGHYVQGLIRRLESGGIGELYEYGLRSPLNTAFLKQVKILWNYGFGAGIGCSTFHEYLSGIPDIPEFPPEYNNHFDKIILVDTRLSLTIQCGLLGVEYDNFQTFVDLSESIRPTQPVYWMNCQDGKRNINRKVPDCRTAFQPFEVGGSAIEGLAIFAQNRNVLEDHYLDLPGSIHRIDFDCVAFLLLCADGPSLRWDRRDCDHPFCGSVSRGIFVG